MNLKGVYKQAVLSNICKEWQGKMKANLSLENLCEMYFIGDDWSMENDFPSLKILREFKGRSEIYGLFTDSSVKIKNFHNAAFFGLSCPLVQYDEFSVGKLIIRHQTKAKLIAKDNAILIVNLLDNAELEIECYDNASVTVFCYDNHNVRSKGNVKLQTSNFKK
jgi:GTPase SAR1 family protein